MNCEQKSWRSPHSGRRTGWSEKKLPGVFWTSQGQPCSQKVKQLCVSKEKLSSLPKISLLSDVSFICVWDLCILQVSSVQLFSRVRLFATPWTATHQATLSITNSQSFLRLMRNELMMPSNDLILCHPLLFLPSIFCLQTHFHSCIIFQIWLLHTLFSHLPIHEHLVNFLFLAYTSTAQ